MMTEQQVSQLVREVTGGGLSRRQLLQRAVALGLSAPAIAAALSETAGAAPGRSTSSATRAFQADATTLILADNMSSGGLWLSLDPAYFYEPNPSSAMNVVYETLYHIPDTTRPDYFEPLLADGEPVLSEDRTEVTIKIRSGVTFHGSGNEMTADDWVYSLNRVKLAQGSPSYLAGYWDRVEAVDPSTLKFTLPAPNPALVAILTSSALSVTDSAVVKEQGGIDEATAGTPEPEAAHAFLTDYSVGTGPFVLASWDVDTEVVLERNPDYWGEAPKLERIIFRNVADGNAQLQSVQSGEADVAFSLDPDAVNQVTSDPNLQLLTTPSISLEYLAMHNQEDPGGPLANADVRRAISHAIDYDGIINDLLKGAAVRPPTVVPLPLPGSEAVQELALATDLARAQELFDASGVGEIEVSLSFRAEGAGAGGLLEETLAAKIQSDLQQINGLTVNLNPMDANQWIEEFRASRLQMTLAPWGPDYPDVLSYVEPFGKTDTQVAARVGYSNPAVDEALERATEAPDAAARETEYAAIQRQLIEDAPYAVLYQPTFQNPARKSVQGVTSHFAYTLQLRGASKSE